MSVKVAINGFGRIGRLAFRQMFGAEGYEVVAINDLTSPEMLANLLKYDTAQGGYCGRIGENLHTVDFKAAEYEEDGKTVKVPGAIIVDGKEITIYAMPNAKDLPWGELDVDVVLECTGFYCSKAKSQAHIDAGAKKVVISAPAGNDLKTIVFSVNEGTLNADDTIISAASCTTNCLAPMVKVLDDKFGVEKGMMSTIHSYTNDQRILDLPHKDPRRARAAAINIIPTTTGAAKAIGEVMPNLKGSLNGASFRVPTPTGSLTDFVAVLKKDVTVEEVNAAMKEAAEGPLKGILAYSEEALVLQDIVSDPHSCIFDSGFTYVVGGNLVKVCGWYDNEWGYSNRAAQAMKKLGDSLGCGCSCGK